MCINFQQNRANRSVIRLKNLTSILSELIDIRDGYKECDGLTCDEINAFILNLCTH